MPEDLDESHTAAGFVDLTGDTGAFGILAGPDVRADVTAGPDVRADVDGGNDEGVRRRLVHGQLRGERWYRPR